MIIQKVSSVLTSRYKNAALRVKASVNFANDLKNFRQHVSEQPDFPINGYFPNYYAAVDRLYSSSPDGRRMRP